MLLWATISGFDIHRGLALCGLELIQKNLTRLNNERIPWFDQGCVTTNKISTVNGLSI